MKPHHAPSLCRMPPGCGFLGQSFTPPWLVFGSSHPGVHGTSRGWRRDALRTIRAAPGAMSQRGHLAARWGRCLWLWETVPWDIGSANPQRSRSQGTPTARLGVTGPRFSPIFLFCFGSGFGCSSSEGLFAPFPETCRGLHHLGPAALHGPTCWGLPGAALQGDSSKAPPWSPGNEAHGPWQAASPKSPPFFFFCNFLDISCRAPKQSFCFRLLALISVPAAPARGREVKSFPLGGDVSTCRAFGRAGFHKPSAGLRQAGAGAR